MNLWSTRESAMEALATSLKPQAACLDEVFSLIDESIRHLHPLPPTLPIETRELAGTAAVVAIKGRNATLGIYGLILDGLAQEAGALLRPLLEALELLAYIQDRDHLVMVMEDKKPSPGLIAQAVDGDFKNLRQALNENASHLGLTDIALGHVIGVSDSGPVLRIVQRYDEAVVRNNLMMLFMFAIRLATETANCAVFAGIEVDDDFRERLVRCRDECVQTMAEKVAAHGNCLAPVFPFEDVVEAHQLMHANRNPGGNWRSSSAPRAKA